VDGDAGQRLAAARHAEQALGAGDGIARLGPGVAAGHDQAPVLDHGQGSGAHPVGAHQALHVGVEGLEARRLRARRREGFGQRADPVREEGGVPAAFPRGPGYGQGMPAPRLLGGSLRPGHGGEQGPLAHAALFPQGEQPSVRRRDHQGRAHPHRGEGGGLLPQGGGVVAQAVIPGDASGVLPPHAREQRALRSPVGVHPRGTVTGALRRVADFAEGVAIQGGARLPLQAVPLQDHGEAGSGAGPRDQGGLPAARAPGRQAVRQGGPGHAARQEPVRARLADPARGEAGPLRIAVGVKGQGTEAPAAQVRGLPGQPGTVQVEAQRVPGGPGAGVGKGAGRGLRGPRRRCRRMGGEEQGSQERGGERGEGAEAGGNAARGAAVRSGKGQGFSSGSPVPRSSSRTGAARG
jgi:hypothetical protein